MNFFLNLGIAMGLKSFVEPLQQLTMMEVNIWERAHRLTTRRLIWIFASHTGFVSFTNTSTNINSSVLDIVNEAIKQIPLKRLMIFLLHRNLSLYLGETIWMKVQLTF